MKRVLLAEDDPDTAGAIKASLEEHLGVAITHVDNGALVPDRIAAECFDLLILDVNLPGLNGVDVFDLIRSGGQHREVPVLFLTAAPDKAQRAFARIGVSDIMRKPFDAEVLAARVSDLMARAEDVA